MTNAIVRDEARSSSKLGGRPSLFSRAVITVYVVDFAAMISFYLLLSVTPLYAGSSGATGAGAGLTTGAMMLAAVAVELISPQLITRFGYRRVLIAGLITLGAPALVVPIIPGTTALVVLSLLRGAGLAVTVVAVAGLAATVIPAERRGEGIGLLGIMSTLPAVLALPLGVLLVDRFGYGPVFAAGAAAALGGAAVALLLPRTPAASDTPMGLLAVLRTPSLLRPAVIFATTAMAASAVATFLPLAVIGSVAPVVPAALLLHTLATTVARWCAGRFADRHGAGRLIVPAVLASAAGVAVLVGTSHSGTVLLGAGLFGAGFGLAQSASLTVMLERTSASGYAAVSAVWNLAYDSGLGLGAIGFGLLATGTGYPTAFALTAALILGSLPLTRSTHRRRIP